MNLGLESLRQSGRLLKAKVVGYKGGEKLLACCPYHRETMPSFAVFSSGGFHCKGCGISGHLSELSRFLEVELPEDFLKRASEKPQNMALEPALLHQAHSIVLAQLALYGPQRAVLEGRGLKVNDLAQLEAQGYRSAPGPRDWWIRRKVADAIVAEMGEEVCTSLPFLQKTQYGWATAGIEGLLVPLQNAAGQVVAFKVRRPNDEPKYLFWKAGGSEASTGAPIHVKQVPGAQLAVVVEGPIKADIVGLRWQEIFGETVAAVAIPGASSHKDLVATLSQLGLKRVLLAMDQDEAGDKATEILRPRLVDAGFEVSVATWPKDLGKIDDFILGPAASVQLRRELHEKTEEAPAPAALISAAFQTMAEARSAAKDWLRETLLGPAGFSVLNLEMGGGKTHTAIELVNELHNAGKLIGQVGLFTQRHEQGEQFEGTASWAKHHGADYDATGSGFDKEPAAKTPCRNLGFALRVINSGAPMKTACAVCPLRSECAGNLARNPDEPFYLAQKMTGKELHLYNTNALRDKQTLAGLATIIIDDTDLEKALVDNKTQTWEDVYQALDWARQHSSYQPMETLLDLVSQLRGDVRKPAYEYDAPRLCGKDLQSKLSERCGGVDNLRAILQLATSAEDASPVDERGNVKAYVPHRILLEMARRLLVELDQADTNPQVSISAAGVSVWKRAYPDFTGKRVIVLNAGAGAEQLQRLFPGVDIKVFNGSVEMPDRTKVIQHYSSPFFTKAKAAKLAGLVLEKLDERAKSHPHETPSDWGLVSFKEVTEAVKEAFPGINTRYFGNQTGSNELENVKFFILAGDHRPNPNAFLEEAQAIYGDQAPLNPATTWYQTQHRDKAGNVATVSHRGYVDQNLDERWQYASIGENRQAFGRPRPFNTGNEEAEQGSLFEGFSVPQRHLDVCILSSYALPGIVPDQLIGPEVTAEDGLVAIALDLRRNSSPVTREALKKASGLSMRLVRELLDRVKLRSEQEFLALNAAVSSTPGLGIVAGVVFAPPTTMRSRATLTCIASVVDPQRGPPSSYKVGSPL